MLFGAVYFGFLARQRANIRCVQIRVVYSQSYAVFALERERLAVGSRQVLFDLRMPKIPKVNWLIKS